MGSDQHKCKFYGRTKAKGKAAKFDSLQEGEANILQSEFQLASCCTDPGETKGQLSLATQSITSGQIMLKGSTRCSV